MCRGSLGRDKISFRGGVKNPGLRQDFIRFRKAHCLKVAEINVNDIVVDSIYIESFTTSLCSGRLAIVDACSKVETDAPPLCKRTKTVNLTSGRRPVLEHQPSYSQMRAHFGYETKNRGRATRRTQGNQKT